MGEGSGGRSAYCLINLRRIKGAALLSDRQDGAAAFVRRAGTARMRAGNVSNRPDFGGR
jgi:hypothetical protein